MIKAEHGEITIEGDFQDTLIELVHIIHGIRMSLHDEEEKKCFDSIIKNVLKETEGTKNFFEKTTTYLEIERHDKNEGETNLF